MMPTQAVKATMAPSQIAHNEGSVACLHRDPLRDLREVWGGFVILRTCLLWTTQQYGAIELITKTNISILTIICNHFTLCLSSLASKLKDISCMFLPNSVE